MPAIAVSGILFGMCRLARFLRSASYWGVLILVGCARDDSDKLVRIARLTADKVRDAAPAKTPFGDMTQDTSPAAKVRSRLKADIYFADHPVQVVEEGDGLHLRGKVPTKEHVELAEQLARQTVGVAKVVNELTVGP